MKKLIIVLFLSILGITSYGQDQKGTDKIIKDWITSFNNQKYGEVYKLYSPTYQSQVSLEKQTKMLKDIYGMMGKLASAKFISYKEYAYKYIFYAKKNQIEADVTLVVDKNSKFSYLSFDAIGGKGDPPPAAKEN